MCYNAMPQERRCAIEHQTQKCMKLDTQFRTFFVSQPNNAAISMHRFGIVSYKFILIKVGARRIIDLAVVRETFSALLSWISFFSKGDVFIFVLLKSVFFIVSIVALVGESVISSKVDDDVVSVMNAEEDVVEERDKDDGEVRVEDTFSIWEMRCGKRIFKIKNMVMKSLLV